MFQFNYAEPTMVIDADPVGLSRAKDPGTGRRVALSWGEHCVECAAPACYTSCDLYRPTETGKCRRFEGGIQRVGLPGQSTPGARVRFRRWGKLEAQGNATLLSSPRSTMVEACLSWAGRLASATGSIARRFGAGYRWCNLADALHKRTNQWLFRQQQRDNRLPNQMLIDVDNLGDEPVRLVLSIAIDKLRMPKQFLAAQLPPPFQYSFELQPGNQRLKIDVADAAHVFASGLPYNLALIPVDREDGDFLFRQIDLVESDEAKPPPDALATPHAPRYSNVAKLVVFDLDNTLWEGVLLEGEVRLRENVEAILGELDERGILMSIASKNNFDDAIKHLQSLKIDHYFIFPQIGWQRKSASLREIVAAIDIGMASVIFVDDNVFERTEVETSLPSVEVLSEKCLPDLLALPRLQGAVTEESKQRRSMYVNAMVRKQVQARFDGDYFAFLRACETRVEFRHPQPADHERIIELVQRTNQLNFSGQKYGREEITVILADEREKCVISCDDKFGKYGTVGFCIFSFDDNYGEQCILHIHDFMLSCRVQGKQIERALLSQLVERSSPPVTSIKVDFRGTNRNKPAQLVLEDIGFKVLASGEYVLDISSANLDVSYLKIGPLS